MISDEDYNAQGTFYFPAGFRSESQYVAFWDAVEVPDRVLDKMLSEQAQLPYRQEPTVTGSDDPEVLRKLESMLQRGTLWPHEFAIQKAKWLGSGHELLTPVLARPVARASGLATHLPPELDDATRDRILDHEFELGAGRWLSARVIVDRFETRGLGFLCP